MNDSPQIGSVTVDKDLCIGSASCVAIDPDHFDLADDGKATFIGTVPLSGDDAQQVLEAARSCPVNAIVVKDPQGERIE